MKQHDNETSAALETVAAFLRRFYLGEEWEDRGTIRALQANPDDRQARWQVASAFDRLLAVELPEGTLQRLVFTSAGQDLLTDAEAREFLERVYEGNGFDAAVNFNEFEQHGRPTQ
jgi:hypothetical protein